MDYTEMKSYLDTTGKSHDEMEMMWKYCVEHGHQLISQLNRCGKRWTDMNTQALSTLEREYNKLKEAQQGREG